MKSMLFGILLVSMNVGAQGIVSKHCAGHCPDGAASTNQVIVREIYILSNNRTTKFADWVAYKVTKKTLGPKRNRNWKADPKLPENATLEKDDYTGANAALKTDRGHQVPLASFAGTKQWRKLNYLSNITPQKSDLNQGSWKRLEAKVRKLAKQNSDVYVISGTLYRMRMPSLPKADEPHTIPSGYFKIIIVKVSSNPDKYKHSAFIFPQSAAKKDSFCKYKVSVADISTASGLRFSSLASQVGLLCSN